MREDRAFNRIDSRVCWRCGFGVRIREVFRRTDFTKWFAKSLTENSSVRSRCMIV